MKRNKKERRSKRMMTPDGKAPETEEMQEQPPEAAQEPTEAPDAPETEAEAEVVDVAKLQADLTAATAQADEYLKLAQRTKADFENFRRRNESVRADSYADGQRSVAAAMLPVKDNLERALQSAQEESPLKSGIELTLKQLRETFDKLGVTEIDRLGEKFDPNLENAVMQGAPEDGEPGTVCMVLQKGYQMGGHVLRHAMVKVVPD